MNAQLHELIIAYGVSAGAMLLGLLLMRAQRSAYLRWPVYSMMAMMLGVVCWNLLRKHLFPAQWSVTHPDALYVGALVLYSLPGLAFGLLLGKLMTRRDAGKTPD